MTLSDFDSVRPPARTPHPDKGKPRGGTKRRHRGDPAAQVPDAEFTSYYSRNVVKPAPWENDIAYYLFLGGTAAGSGLLGAGAHLTERRTLQRNARFTALGATGVGAYFLVADLGRPERFLNMMRVVKLTSPMSVGTWILAGFGTSAGGAAAVEVARLVLPEDHLVRKIGEFFDPVASFGSAFFAPPLAAYTAVLFSDTATPLWHQVYRELPFLFVASGLGAGCGAAMISTPTAETAPVRALAGTSAAFELVMDQLLERRLGEEGQPLHEGVAAKYHKAARVLTAAGGIGAVLAGRNRVGAALSGAALLAGSLCTRMAIYKAGLESAKDPIYTIRPQRRRAAAKRAHGYGVTQPGGEWPRVR